jgi:hypothetical protein
VQRQRDLGFQRQGRMATGEYQLQSIIRNRVVHLGFVLVSGGVEDDRFALQRRRAPQAVDGAASGDGQQPRAGVARNAVSLPAF